MASVTKSYLTKHVLAGLGAALALLSVYLIVVSLTQGFKHALEQAASLWLWITPLAIGFGVQAALFLYLRECSRKQRLSATASVTASGGVSVGSMVACCAHHLSDLVPVIGITGLAVFLSQYQKIFLLAGILSNVVGIAIMLESIQRMNLSVSPLLNRWDMKYMKKWVIGLALSIFVGVSFVQFIT